MEDKKEKIIAGVDESGRGAYAGPLVAAAVCLPKNDGLPLRDSKKIAKGRHRYLAEQICRVATDVGIGVASVEYINQNGVGCANRYAMEQAVRNLKRTPDHLLIDGNKQHELNTPIPQTQMIKGDATFRVIAAASIVAKAVHDELMLQAHKEYPRYGFCNHTGYHSPEHERAMDRYGLTPYHRTCVKPIRKRLQQAMRKNV